MHIKRLCSFLGTGFYCHLCKVKCSNAHEHYNCPLMCRRCGHRTSDGILTGCEGDIRLACKDCNRQFLSQECYDRHQELGPRGGRSWCQLSQVCGACNSVITDRHVHRCHESYCHTCQVSRLSDHKCSISKVPPAKENDNEVRIAYDIEVFYFSIPD